MLTVARKTEIETSATEATPSSRLSDVVLLQTGEELQYYATSYNWDDGFDVPFAIAKHPKCDLGVALGLFWLAEAQCWLTGEIQPDQYNQNWISFCRLITEGILSGKYAKGLTSFRSGFGVARVYQFKKKGVPEILLTDVLGSDAVTTS